MVCAFIAAAVALRPNSCLAGVLGSSGCASAGGGCGLRLPLSCASAGPPMVDTSKAPKPRVVTCVFSDRRAIMGNLPGFCLAIRRPDNANAHPTQRRKNMSDSRPVNCGRVGCALAVFGRNSADQGDSLMPEYLEKTEFQAARAYSPAVITQGGRIAWLAGQTATRDERSEEHT